MLQEIQISAGYTRALSHDPVDSRVPKINLCRLVNFNLECLGAIKDERPRSAY